MTSVDPTTAVPSTAVPSTRAPVGAVELLAAAVQSLAGQERPGQVEMAVAVADAFDTGEHLLVQAGTGTGKSLAYLVPALVRSGDGERPVVVATATIALQRQLVERDLPRLVETAAPLLGRQTSFAMLKGRSNYVCLQRLHSGPEAADEQDALFDAAPTSRAGRDVVRIRQWAESTETGDRDELVPAPDDRAWRSLAVTPRECLGAQRCPHGVECFTERARERARHADVVVTNHAMLAVDALSEATLLPEADAVVIDEGHELADRATGAVTDELTAAQVERAARGTRKLAGAELTDRLEDAAAAFASALDQAPAGRLDTLPPPLFDALVAIRDVGHAVLTAIGSGRGEGDALAARVRARAVVAELHEMAGRVVAAGDGDVVWVTKSDRRPPALSRAPLFVGGLLREQLFGERTVVLTSATLELGGGFEPVARGLGLVGDDAPPWRGLDVGSPFDYGAQSILYTAAHLPPPTREGQGEAFLTELAELVEAAGGRTLGLFSSMRAARAAAEAMRERLDVPVLCQGDDATSELVRQFATEAATCLFGTLSLWQGVDVPGSALQLVVIDRLPFPRPDDPLASARQRAVEAAGGNGFLSVAATQAALLLAQGAGRLIRTPTDRGVVAVLDSRLATARYGGFIRSSLPPMWPTTDPAVVRRSLAALAAAAPEPLPVPPRGPAAGAPLGLAPGARSDGDEGESAAEADRRGRRWSPAEEQALTEAFRAGTPVLLLAEELGRSPSAVAGRLRQLDLTGRLVWGRGEQLPRADVELGYALTRVALPTEPAAGLARCAEVLALDGWQAGPEHDLTLRVRRGDVDAVLAFGDADALLLGAATSRWLLVTDPDVTEVPGGVDAVVVAAVTDLGTTG